MGKWGKYENNASKCARNPQQENNVQALSLVEASSMGGVYIYRNQVGTFYTREGQPVKVGVIGSADSIGFCSVTIDESWLGKQVGLFFGAEFKRPRGGVQSPEQKKWQAHINKLGAPYRLIKSPDEMRQFINDIKSGDVYEEAGK